MYILYLYIAFCTVRNVTYTLCNFMTCFQFHCCGSNGPSDWSNSVFNNQTNKEKDTALTITLRSSVTSYNIPISCCIASVDPETCQQATHVNVTAAVPDQIYKDVSFSCWMFSYNFI